MQLKTKKKTHEHKGTVLSRRKADRSARNIPTKSQLTLMIYEEDLKDKISEDNQTQECQTGVQNCVVTNWPSSFCIPSADFKVMKSPFPFKLLESKIVSLQNSLSQY